ncbi:unnamed protein product [Zymoseptoria tritici ST99CH_1E4]|uniref:Uncharacterized protein n=1 Tax=Zymoseptoria tritici ST99CH_1E4 TaxID=1276532 RepID=A0A2H1GYY3_ZYMTR|nr:unnamed protein product [Zymoseptoria tritici ST99CH_1E4]
MLYTRLFSRALTISAFSSTTRAMSTMSSAVSPQAFALDRSIFNDTLYSSLRTFWFQDIPAGSKASNEESMKRWWGKGRSSEESQAMDNECRQKFGSALRAIGPENLKLPDFKSYDEELKHASELSKPFVDEVEAAQKSGGEDKAAETLLSLVLLLDQMPRHVHRDPAGLQLVYGHYDRLSWSLLRSRLAAEPGLFQQSYFRGNPVTVSWLGMPLMHAEHLESQQMALRSMEKCHEEAVIAGDNAAAASAEKSFAPAKSHLDIVSRFKRFPHRNEALGQQNTADEAEWLKTGETFGVKQHQESDESVNAEL